MTPVKTFNTDDESLKALLKEGLELYNQMFNEEFKKMNKEETVTISKREYDLLRENADTTAIERSYAIDFFEDCSNDPYWCPVSKLKDLFKYNIEYWDKCQLLIFSPDLEKVNYDHLTGSFEICDGEFKGTNLSGDELFADEEYGQFYLATVDHKASLGISGCPAAQFSDNLYFKFLKF